MLQCGTDGRTNEELKIELLSQWKLEAEFRNLRSYETFPTHIVNFLPPLATKNFHYQLVTCPSFNWHTCSSWSYHCILEYVIPTAPLCICESSSVKPPSSIIITMSSSCKFISVNCNLHSCLRYLGHSFCQLFSA